MHTYKFTNTETGTVQTYTLEALQTKFIVWASNNPRIITTLGPKEVIGIFITVESGLNSSMDQLTEQHEVFVLLKALETVINEYKNFAN